MSKTNGPCYRFQILTAGFQIAALAARGKHAKPRWKQVRSA